MRGGGGGGGGGSAQQAPQKVHGAARPAHSFTHPPTQLLTGIERAQHHVRNSLAGEHVAPHDGGLGRRRQQRAYGVQWRRAGWEARKERGTTP